MVNILRAPESSEQRSYIITTNNIIIQQCTFYTPDPRADVFEVNKTDKYKYQVRWTFFWNFSAIYYYNLLYFLSESAAAATVCRSRFVRAPAIHNMSGWFLHRETAKSYFLLANRVIVSAVFVRSSEQFSFIFFSPSANSRDGDHLILSVRWRYGYFICGKNLFLCGFQFCSKIFSKILVPETFFLFPSILKCEMYTLEIGILWKFKKMNFV